MSFLCNRPRQTSDPLHLHQSHLVWPSPAHPAIPGSSLDSAQALLLGVGKKRAGLGSGGPGDARPARGDPSGCGASLGALFLGPVAGHVPWAGQKRGGPPPARCRLPTGRTVWTLREGCTGCLWYGTDLLLLRLKAMHTVPSRSQGGPCRPGLPSYLTRGSHSLHLLCRNVSCFRGSRMLLKAYGGGPRGLGQGWSWGPSKEERDPRGLGRGEGVVGSGASLLQVSFFPHPFPVLG